MKARAVAIVGPRRRNTEADRKAVEDLVKTLAPDTKVISGGAGGIDTFAIEAAKKFHLEWEVILPETTPGMPYYEVCRAMYDRNKKVAERASVVYAFVSKNREGGTENTIKWAKKLKKNVELFPPR